LNAMNKLAGIGKVDCNMKRTDCLINGKTCSIFEYGALPENACVFCGMDAVQAGREDEAIQVAELLRAAEGESGYSLFVFRADDWNAEFSPWPAPAVYGNEPFTGKANATLRWLEQSAIPYLNLPVGCKKYLSGYSLVGLFALWAFMESGLFDGASSCSGSLWFPNWTEYMEQHPIIRDSIVYLSLGSKEERTKNLTMAAVGDNTRKSYALLKQNPHIQKVTLEWNKGGHFTAPAERLAKGILWLLRNGETHHE